MSYATFEKTTPIPLNVPAYMFEGSAGHYPFPAKYHPRPVIESEGFTFDKRYRRGFKESEGFTNFIYPRARRRRPRNIPIFPSYWTQYNAFYGHSPYGYFNWFNNSFGNELWPVRGIAPWNVRSLSYPPAQTLWANSNFRNSYRL